MYQLDIDLSLPRRFVTFNEQGLVKCDCKGFRYLSLCSHSVAISGKEGSLSLHFTDGTKGLNSAIHFF